MKKTALGATIALTLFTTTCGKGIGDGTGGSGPTGTPTPAATATATPAATPTGTPSANAACKLTALPNCDARCCTNGGSIIHRGEIESAQEEVARTQPGLFLPGGNVRNNVDYMTVLARTIQNRSNGNTCAEVLGHDEIRIKSDQNVSQHVDVLIADITPAVLGAYTCRPASF